MTLRRITHTVALAAIALLAAVSISRGAAAPADAPLPMKRLTPKEISALAATSPRNALGVQMTNLIGDPAKPGLYTVRVAIPAHTQAPPHTHRDNRSVTVISGTWQMGYGTKADPQALVSLPPGSVYTEPANRPHFSQTTSEPVVILVTGYGPSDTHFIAN